MRNRRLILLILTTACVGGCSKPDSPAARVEDRPIADCLTLTAPQNREYRIAAKRECLAQPSLDARMKSKGCLVIQEVGRCLATKEAQANRYDAAQVNAEATEARRR